MIKSTFFKIVNANVDKLNDIHFIEDTLVYATKSASMTYIKSCMHQFEPQGVTGVVLLAESHISIHTYPEYGYAICDVLTCSEESDNMKAAQAMVQLLEGELEVINNTCCPLTIDEYA